MGGFGIGCRVIRFGWNTPRYGTAHYVVLSADVPEIWEL